MNELNSNARRLLDQGAQNLVKVGILDEKLLLTSVGKEHLLNILFWKHRGELETIAKEQLELVEAGEDED